LIKFIPKKRDKGKILKRARENMYLKAQNIYYKRDLPSIPLGRTCTLGHKILLSEISPKIIFREMPSKIQKTVRPGIIFFINTES
jgi:hypothetical protein